ncbi:ATP-binding cassette, subfamily B [Nonomuraea solani]|uniref:ATP-binding cassette, subfamily B n=1 Tax=Nonomuraea solani TaxID=1144553 RepID=A0A1H6EPZ5_9ACTN|nr:ABC transporter ATP-binding protein [Nonomuraea solani]SEG99917.1 ATP-binding cassette, subfamily B [Nonomuraea solani]
MAVPERFPRLRVLWSFARPHTRTLALGLVLALVTSGLGLASPMVTKWVLDELGTGGSLAGPIAALLGLLVVGAVIARWQWTKLGALGERVVLDARESMVRRFLRATVPAITRHPPGELVTRVTSDTVLLREAATSSVIGLINGVVMLAGTLVLMSVLDLVLLGVTVAAVSVVIVLFALLMPTISKAQERAQEQVGRLGGVLEGALRAVRTVKVSRAEDRQADRILSHARTSAEHGVRAVRAEATAWTIAWSGVQLAIILVLGIGAWRVGAGQLEVSGLIAFLLYAFGLMDPITELSQNFTALQSGIAAAERIREIDAIETEPVTRPGARQSPAGAGGPVLEFRGVTAVYGPDAEPAVRGVDLAIPRRGHVAVVGPSGAGKTTLFSLVLGFLEPQDGTLLLDGRPYAEYTRDEIRSRLAYVEQDTPVVPGTIRDNLLFSHPDATEEELAGVLADVRLAGKVAVLDDGLDTPLSSTQVSGGERQRIALARALLRTPDVLLLDEATAQLDGLTEAAVHDCVRARAATSAVVTIAHRLSTVIDADEIILMEDGRVRARGGHAELLATDTLYQELVASLRISAQPATAV